MRSSSGEALGYRSRRATQDSIKDNRGREDGEGNFACGQFIKHDGERKQIRARTKLFSTSLLRAHVCDRTDRTTGAGKAGFGQSFSLAPGVLMNRFTIATAQFDLCESKIEDLRLPAIGEKNIGWLANGLFAPLSLWWCWRSEILRTCL
jgi:hypothetical protein